jgi:hypothetical protein
MSLLYHLGTRGGGRRTAEPRRGFIKIHFVDQCRIIQDQWKWEGKTLTERSFEVSKMMKKSMRVQEVADVLKYLIKRKG